MSNDGKLRALLIYRLDPSTLYNKNKKKSSSYDSVERGEGSGLMSVPGVLCLAKHDHLESFEAHRGSGSGLYGDREKSFDRHVAQVIAKDPPSPPRNGDMGGFKVVASDSHQVVFGTDTDGLCVAVITGKRFASRVAIQMLMEVHGQVLQQFGIMQLKSANTNEQFTKKAKNLMSSVCNKYSDVTKVDKAAALNAKVENVKVEMQDNIAQMLENTDKADHINQVSNQLNEQAQVFKKKSTDLKKDMRWKNLKLTLIIAFIVLGLILVIVVPMIMKAKNAVGR